jgi:hypothetical protein
MLLHIPNHICIRTSLGAFCLAFVFSSAAWSADANPRFSFAAFGCMPYTTENYPAYERLLAEISRQRPAFTVNCGDTKAGAQPPTDEYYEQVKAWFNSIEGPVIYTPGDNEWTDVHRETNGRENPLVWLGKVRSLYFSEERSLGREPMLLITQRRDEQFSRFVENARWTYGRVVFATVHVVGSNNNCDATAPGAIEEFTERDAANTAWIRATFAEARATNAPGVGFFFQAEPINAHANAERAGNPSGFKAFLATLDLEARSFGKPVLLVHADDHRFRIESRVTLIPGGGALENVTRLGTFGSNDVHGVLVVVDPESPGVFQAGPLIVPENVLPELPKPKKKAAAPKKKA